MDTKELSEDVQTSETAPSPISADTSEISPETLNQSSGVQESVTDEILSQPEPVPDVKETFIEPPSKSCEPAAELSDTAPESIEPISESIEPAEPIPESAEPAEPIPESAEPDKPTGTELLEETKTESEVGAPQEIENAAIKKELTEIIKEIDDTVGMEEDSEEIIQEGPDGEVLKQCLKAAILTPLCTNPEYHSFLLLNGVNLKFYSLFMSLNGVNP